MCGGCSGARKAARVSAGSPAVAQVVDRENRRHVAVLLFELHQQVRDMLLHGRDREAKDRGNLAVLFPSGHPEQHLALARRQAESAKAFVRYSRYVSVLRWLTLSLFAYV